MRHKSLPKRKKCVEDIQLLCEHAKLVIEKSICDEIHQQPRVFTNGQGLQTRETNKNYETVG